MSDHESYSIGVYICPYCHQAVHTEEVHNCPASQFQTGSIWSDDERLAAALERIARSLEALERKMDRFTA